jgi:hypothetical protein
MTGSGSVQSGEHADREYEGDVYGDAYKKAQQENPGHWFTDPSAPADKAALVAGQYSQQQGQTLAQGQSYRSDLAPSDQLYNGVPHAELAGYVNDGLDPEQIDNHGRAWNSQGNSMVQFGDDLAQALTKEKASWRGAGAEAMFALVHQMSAWTQTTGDAAQLASHRLSESAAESSRAKNTMPAEVPFNRDAEMATFVKQLAGDWKQAGDTVGNIPAKQAASVQAQQQAAQVVHTYDQSLYGFNSQQPQFVPPPQPGQGDTSPIFSTVSGPGVGKMVDPTNDHGDQHTSIAGYQAPPPGPGTPVGLPAPGGLPGGSAVQQTPGNFSGAGQFPGTGNTGTSDFGGVGNGGGVPRAAGLGLGDAMMPGAGGGFGGGDIERSGSGVGGRGNFAGGRLNGAGGAKEGALTGGKESGAGKAPGAASAEESARTGAPGGKGSSSSATGAPGGKGKGDKEDKEHKRKTTVVDDDPNETYGLNIEEGPDGKRIAPPTIGI